jgi:hypothetical protein
MYIGISKGKPVISEKPVGGTNLLTNRPVRIRERILRWLLGDIKKIMIIMPSDDIRDITISESAEAGEAHG